MLTLERLAERVIESAVAFPATDSWQDDTAFEADDYQQTQLRRLMYEGDLTRILQLLLSTIEVACANYRNLVQALQLLKLASGQPDTAKRLLATIKDLDPRQFEQAARDFNELNGPRQTEGSPLADLAMLFSRLSEETAAATTHQD